MSILLGLAGSALASGGKGGIAGVLSGGVDSATDTVNSSINALTGGLFSKLGLDFSFGGTIGAVLNNGLNLSCWGASLTPQVANGRLQEYYDPFFNHLLSKVQNASNTSSAQSAVNEYAKYAYMVEGYYRLWKHKQADWSSCAMKAITDVYRPYFAAIKAAADQIVSDLVAQGAVKTEMAVKARYTIPGTVTGKSNYTSGVNKDTNTVNVPVISFPSGFGASSTNNAGKTAVSTKVANLSQNGLSVAPSTNVKGANHPDKDSASFPWWVAIPFII